MKKHDHKHQRDVQTSSALREVQLLSLIFGGAMPDTRPLGTSLPMMANLNGPKEPPGGGE